MRGVIHSEVLRSMSGLSVLAVYFVALLLPVFVSGLLLTGWFLTKGVDAAKWEARAAG